jgi:hypothetical protein
LKPVRAFTARSSFGRGANSARGCGWRKASTPDDDDDDEEEEEEEEEEEAAARASAGDGSNPMLRRRSLAAAADPMLGGEAAGGAASLSLMRKGARVLASTTSSMKGRPRPSMSTEGTRKLGEGRGARGVGMTMK